MSISAGAMETAQEFLRKLNPAIRCIPLTPINFGLTGELPWDQNVWESVRWALGVNLGVSEQLIDNPPAEGLPILTNWLLKAGQLDGYRCLWLENTEERRDPLP